MQNENTRNTVIFIVCTLAILIFYQVFVMQPAAERRKAAQVATSEQAADAPNTVLRPETAVFTEDRTQALGGAERVRIQTPTLTGSMSLLGGRIDDLYLSQYRETIDEGSPAVELFRPQSMRHSYFAQFGWTGQNITGGVPGPNTVWRLTGGSVLTPTTPVTLAWDNGAGLRFTRVVSIDEQYLFTISDTVANLGTTAITIRPYGMVERQGIPADLGKQMILHEGAIGTFGEEGSYSTRQLKYSDWTKKPSESHESTGGWMGITDKYWLAAIIPTQTEAVSGRLTAQGTGDQAVYRARMQAGTVTIQPDRQIVETQRLFAGVKRNEILKAYEEDLGLPRFVYAIDWGFLFFLTRPIFLTVHFFQGLVGNFGVAILLLTVVVKLIMFPLANKAYESLSKMKTLQPKMEEIKKKYADDPQQQQKETMALYSREKINPLAGCVPILIQIPVFYALYKVLFVTIEMRHAPFFGWIQDLSARDPSTLWTVFGLIPWNPADLVLPLFGAVLDGPLHLGVLPIFYGLTMWLQQAMNPPAPDPIQRQIFAFLPFIFTFIMAPFAAGLLIYWAWNNVLSIIQQYYIMHRFKAENPIDTFIAKLRQPKGA